MRTPPLRTGRAAGPALALSLALTLAAVAGCVAPAPQGPAGDTSMPAVAPGVTADGIKVGITYPDLEAVRQFVQIDHGDYVAAYDAVIARINAQGGINGRLIVPVYAKINPVGPAPAQEACARLAQDEKVFAALGFFNSDDPLCYVETQRTAVFGGAFTEAGGARAKAPWFSTAGGDGITAAVAKFAEQGELLKGRKIAVVGSVLAPKDVEKAKSALTQAGSAPVETATLDAAPNDTVAVAQQSAVIVERFRAAGADTVFAIGPISTSIGTQIEKTPWRPRFLFPDLGSGALYAADQAPHDWSVLAGATAAGIRSDFQDPEYLACLEDLYRADPSRRGTVLAPEAKPQGSPDLYTSVLTACQNIALFRAVAAKAGTKLDYRTLKAAGDSLGAFHVPGVAGTAEYSAASPYGKRQLSIAHYDPTTRRFTVAP
ncbi:ABC transporter substrate-binding protein [Streptomyces sp. ISL-43]|uniref:ABC transporter substrate-binding protein n=1 Tax=Streptomyces sp. ISL-43 TaxID=2819183 RepID=UPI001BE57A81|nr:ABC transporter substrate-binding protein [Streptomyces sp. ISL-43]MBT2452251.1 ABC transporter substrate-binding protein [Streptomyces sp. ISL-43]